MMKAIQLLRRKHLLTTLICLPQSTTIRAFTSSTFSRRRHLRQFSMLESGGGEAAPEDLSKWEQMYEEGEFKSALKKGDLDFSQSIVDQPASSEVRVVTFDLDNTLWKTGPTIQAANDALAAYLDEEGIVQPQRVEKVMGQLFTASKTTYAPLQSDPKSPVLLTKLRQDALVSILQESNGYNESDAQEFAQRAFSLWTEARHAALPQYFATGVEECLQQIRSAPTSRPILIGAITDGNSDPRTVPQLKQYFDFVVNAEQVGISKPDRRVYLAAIQEAATHPFLEDIFDGDENEQTLEDMIGPWWVHVGDDFLKDIAAAKDLGMRSIWQQELLPKEDKTLLEEKKPAKTVEEFVGDITKKMGDDGLIRMAVGADDFLADSIQDEFADAIIDSFDQVGATVIEWNESASRSDVVGLESEQRKEDLDQLSDILTLTTPDSESKPEAKEPAQNTKFCIECGTKLPVTAKFCSSCGEKQ